MSVRLGNMYPQTLSLNQSCEDDFWMMCFPVFAEKETALKKGQASLQGLADAKAAAFLETVADHDRKVA